MKNKIITARQLKNHIVSEDTALKLQDLEYSYDCEHFYENGAKAPKILDVIAWLEYQNIFVSVNFEKFAIYDEEDNIYRMNTTFIGKLYKVVVSQLCDDGSVTEKYKLFEGSYFEALNCAIEIALDFVKCNG